MEYLIKIIELILTGNSVTLILGLYGITKFAKPISCFLEKMSTVKAGTVEITTKVEQVSEKVDELKDAFIGLKYGDYHNNNEAFSKAVSGLKSF